MAAEIPAELTHRQARAVLGVVATALREGYDIAERAPPESATVIRGTLDHINIAAQGAYAVFHDTDEPATSSQVQLVAGVVDLTADVIGTLETVSPGLGLAGRFDRAVSAAVAKVPAIVGEALSKLAMFTWPVWLAVGVAVGVLAYLWLKGRLV